MSLSWEIQIRDQIIFERNRLFLQAVDDRERMDVLKETEKWISENLNAAKKAFTDKLADLKSSQLLAKETTAKKRPGHSSHSNPDPPKKKHWANIFLRLIHFKEQFLELHYSLRWSLVSALQSLERAHCFFMLMDASASIMIRD